MYDVTVRFSSESKAEAFMDWLDNSGEQEYFTASDMLDGENFVESFHYDYPNMIITGED